MASLEQRKSGYRVVFMWQGERVHRSLETQNKRKAETLVSRLEENLADWKRGRFQIPSDVPDIATFLLSDGLLNSLPTGPVTVILTDLFERYFAAQPDGALEANSISTMQTHRRHFADVLGKSFPMHTLTRSHLQEYVNARAKAATRTGTVKAVTIRKELMTLSGVWNWGRDEGLVEGEFPRRGLMFPKGKEKPPFQTWEEIERKIAKLDLKRDRQTIDELWDALFLNVDQMDDVLQFVRRESRFPVVHPMLFMAAHTGARRSELLRSHVTDFDLDGRTVTLREKKRKKGHDTTRSVPLSMALRRVMTAWLEGKRGLTFGDLTVDMSNHYLRESLTGKWSTVRGWHVFRHSFASTCASKGVDQRFINRWMGHQTEEMMKRYQHLFPQDQKQAIDAVFS